MENTLTQKIWCREREQRHRHGRIPCDKWRQKLRWCILKRRNTRGFQQLPEGWRGTQVFCVESSEGAWPCFISIFGLQNFDCVTSTSLWKLSWQPQDMIPEFKVLSSRKRYALERRGNLFFSVLSPFNVGMGKYINSQCCVALNSVTFVSILSYFTDWLAE